MRWRALLRHRPEVAPVVEPLARLGVTTLGQLAALSRASVADRFGRVGELAQAVGLSQSALSQHLAKMREEGLVAFRREGQVLFYRLDDPRCEALLATLHRLYCSQEN